MLQIKVICKGSIFFYDITNITEKDMWTHFLEMLHLLQLICRYLLNLQFVKSLPSFPSIFVAYMKKIYLGLSYYIVPFLRTKVTALNEETNVPYETLWNVIYMEVQRDTQGYLFR